MARLTLSPNGLKSPLDLDAPSADKPRVATVEPIATPAPPAAPDTLGVTSTATTAPGDEPNVADTTTDAPPVTFAVVPDLDAAPDATHDGAADELPEWAQALDPIALQPARLLGRPKQTALILDRELSARADALVAATGPRVTFAALVIAVLHFHLPADGEAAARAIGGYRRRKLEALEHPWEERNARLPGPLRTELDDVVSGAVGRVAAVRRSTLVNALLDAHLPDAPDDAARLVTRMEMVRGGAFLA